MSDIEKTLLDSTNCSHQTLYSGPISFNQPMESPKERFERLISDAKLVEATSPNVDVDQLPDYFDAVRFERAQATCQKYYTNLSMSSFTGLVLLMQVDSILIPLLKTGKSRTVADLYDRYTGTAKYIRNIYETDFYDPSSKGGQDIKLVRAMHKRIHSMMNGSTGEAENQIWVNQYDMALTQFAFIGLFLLKPDKCGSYHVNRQELSDISYYWRLISYYFGIEEQFNLFVYNDEHDKQLELMTLVLDHFRELLSEPRNQVGLSMAEGLALAYEDFSTESSFNILDHWWSPYLSLSGSNPLKPYSFSDRYKLIFFYLYFKVLFRSQLILQWMNVAYKKKFDKFCESADRIKAKLRRKYGDFVYEMPQ